MIMILQVLAAWSVLAGLVAATAAVLGRGAKLTALRNGYQLHEQGTVQAERP